MMLKQIPDINRHNDLVLALLLVAIISLIILPLPTAVMDTLIAVNLGLAIILLMLSLYIPDSISLSTFPTLLLLTTLFRLSLNIATTRLILINADAGQIIYTFGNFVVAGNFVVGAIVFLIITIVQFVVIARGSERVAEVAARFTLDAMPGKQMSIDADVRAGNIDMEEAIRRRSAVQTESSLYGAMDGAMKFVKGDAISGLIITIINILGGITIGVLQKGMPVVHALETYCLLTIGDGLISQIPALFISITSGIIVTRSNKVGNGNLGSEIGAQLSSQPKGLILSGLLLCAFAVIPGFPKFQFVLLGLAIFVIGYSSRKKRALARKHKGQDDIDPLQRAMGALSPKLQKAKKDGDFSPTIPLQIDLDAGIKHIIDPVAFNRELIQIRRILYLDLGLPFPGIHLNLNPSMPKGRYAILIHEIPVAQGVLKPGHLFVTESAVNLEVLGIEHTEDKPFLPGHATVWVSADQRKKLDTADIGYLPPTRVVAYHISLILRQHAHEFIGLQEVKSLIEKMGENFPDVVEELQKNITNPQLADILQRLLQENISIRNLKAIFQCLIEHGAREKDIVMLTEYVRMALKRYISYRYSGGQNMLGAYMLDQQVEETIRKAIRKNGPHSYLVLSPGAAKPIVDAIRQVIGENLPRSAPPVLLTSMDVRRYVRKLIETEIKTLPVLSYQELSSELTIQPLGRICLHQSQSN
jgi:type III secretion protein V